MVLCRSWQSGLTVTGTSGTLLSEIQRYPFHIKTGHSQRRHRNFLYNPLSGTDIFPFMIITHLLLAVLWISWCTLHSAMISLSVTSYLEHRPGQGYRFYRLFFNAVAVVTLLPVYLYGQGIDQSPVPYCARPFADGQNRFIAHLTAAVRDGCQGVRFETFHRTTPKPAKAFFSIWRYHPL